jgi:hypothetical protein
MLPPGQYHLGSGVRSAEGGTGEDHMPQAIPFGITVSSQSAEINGQSFGVWLAPRMRFSTAVAGTDSER